jgi:TolB-like protein/rhodanese-related sulfurtransferase/Flp pilus assembly protein TadD
MGVDDSGTLAALKAHRRELIDPKIAEHEGRIVKATGDGLLLEFSSVVDAVCCAVEVQRGMAERNESVAPDKRLDFRIGINVGDIIIDGDDIFGDGVNVAARLETLADPGGICVSRVVRDQVLDKLSFAFEDLGAQQVKNIARPVEVFRLDLGSAARQVQGRNRWGWQRLARSTDRRWLGAVVVTLLVVGATIGWYTQSSQTTRGEAASVPTATNSSDKPSLAVLPFDSLGGSSDNSYFADGMTDDIITDLSKLSRILVIARNSSSTYKGKSTKVQQVAKDLGVRYVLQGSVRREGDTVRINAQLVDALGGQHLWAERYDGSMRDIFALQDRVIRQIVAALAVKLTHDERTRLELAETRNPQAYDAVVRGWAHYRQGSEEDTKKAIALFEQAIALDPAYGRAHAALAAVSWRIAQSYWELTTQGGFQRAFDRMQKALADAARQPNALAHAVSAEFLSKQGRYEEAFTEIGKAMALAPNDPDNYLSKARILNATGRAAEAEESVRWAMRLDPLYSADYLRTLAMSLFHQQRYEEAVGTVERLLALRTDVADDYVTLIAGLGHLGRKSGAPEAIKTANRLNEAAGLNTITVQMSGGWWWYGDIFNYDPAYRDRLMEGLRKAGVPEGAGTDIPLEKVRRLLHKDGEGYYDVTGATTIDLQHAKTLHERGVKFVDVRAAKDFASGHVPRSFNLDVATDLSRDTLSRIVGKDEELVMSCHGKYCPDSAYASAKAVLWGFKRVYYFSAGFPAWNEAGYPVEVSPTK